MTVLEIVFLCWAVVATLYAIYFFRQWRQEQRGYRAFARGVSDGSDYLRRRHTQVVSLLVPVIFAGLAFLLYKNRERLKELFRNE